MVIRLRNAVVRRRGSNGVVDLKKEKKKGTVKKDTLCMCWSWDFAANGGKDIPFIRADVAQTSMASVMC